MDVCSVKCLRKQTNKTTLKRLYCGVASVGYKKTTWWIHVTMCQWYHW